MLHGASELTHSSPIQIGEKFHWGLYRAPKYTSSFTTVSLKTTELSTASAICCVSILFLISVFRC